MDRRGDVQDEGLELRLRAPSDEIGMDVVVGPPPAADHREVVVVHLNEVQGPDQEPSPSGIAPK